MSVYPDCPHGEEQLESGVLNDPTPKSIEWGDLADFDEMFKHICEHSDGFTYAQMETVRAWMHAGISWKQMQHVNEIHDFKSILLRCYNNGIDSVNFDGRLASENKLATEEILKFPISDCSLNNNEAYR